jgi:integrase
VTEIREGYRAIAITRAPVSGGISSTLMPSVHQEMSTYTPDEIRRVLRAADKDLRNGHLWYLALFGLRRAEIAGLRWSDVDRRLTRRGSRTPPTR